MFNDDPFPGSKPGGFEMAEQVFFDRGTVKVTNARFIVGSQTYAMNGVTSVKNLVEPAKRGGAIVALIIGVLMLLSGPGGVRLVGLVVAGVAGLLLYLRKDRHIVLLHSASGEARALADTDETMINEVVTALNDALIHRG